MVLTLHFDQIDTAWYFCGGFVFYSILDDLPPAFSNPSIHTLMDLVSRHFLHKAWVLDTPWIC